MTLCQELWPDHLDGNMFFLLANLILCYLFPLAIIILCYVGIWIKVSRLVTLIGDFIGLPGQVCFV